MINKKETTRKDLLKGSPRKDDQKGSTRKDQLERIN